MRLPPPVLLGPLPEEAQFSAPQGLLFGEGILLVADAGNHAVRLIDLERGRVSTLAGTGHIGSLRQAGEYDALHLELRLPWDLALKGGQIYIAMAGNHQIWRLGLADGKIRPYAPEFDTPGPISALFSV